MLTLDVDKLMNFFLLLIECVWVALNFSFFFIQFECTFSISLIPFQLTGKKYMDIMRDGKGNLIN
jgi:hypothetical protein